MGQAAFQHADNFNYGSFVDRYEAEMRQAIERGLVVA
jgi:hypothetical protein